MRSRLQWTGHVERMADERLPKRAAELREQGRKRRGRSIFYRASILRIVNCTLAVITNFLIILSKKKLKVELSCF